MKKTLIALSILGVISFTSGNYTLKFPLEQAKGGNLPNGSIKLGNTAPAPVENWVAIEPFYTEWVNSGVLYGCTNWSPDTNTVTIGQEFTQTATDCEQPQTRTRQEREKETTTLAYRDVGLPIIEIQTIAATDTREAVGTLSEWEAFAVERDLRYNWANLDWGLKSLTSLPNSPYPLTSVNYLYLYTNQLTNVDSLSNLTNVNYELALSGNQLTNVDGLSNLTSVKTLYLNNNNLKNVNGLSKLTSAQYIYLSNNQLTNVNGLSNLTSVNYDIRLEYNQLTNVNGLSNLTSVKNLYLENNQLENVYGLAKVKVSSKIIITANYSGPKLAANTRFCTENPDSVFESGYAQKSQLCESP